MCIAQPQAITEYPYPGMSNTIELSVQALVSISLCFSQTLPSAL